MRKGGIIVCILRNVKLFQIDKLSYALPDSGLLVEPVPLEAAEVAARDDADDALALDHRKMAVAAIAHQAQRLDRGAPRRDGVGIARHDVGKRGLAGATALGQDAADRVPSGEDSDEPL